MAVGVAPYTDPLRGGGEMGALMRSIDWDATAVGPASTWPQSLRTALSILLETGFPMYIAWGRAFTQFYNDSYRPILGATKHPAAMGRSTRETFAEIWHIIGPMFDGVMEGRATTLVDFLLPLDRHGFVEDCYFIFSYSPIREESGQVGGVLVTVTETTERVLGTRRLQTLQALASRTPDAATAEAACQIAAAVMHENPADLPRARLYLLTADGKTAKLAGVAGSAAAPGASPAEIDLTKDGAPWPVAAVVATGRERIVEDASERTMVIPVASPGAPRPAGVLVAALSPRLAFDQSYRSFIELVAGHVATAVANARALAEANARAEALAEIDRAKTVFFSNVSHEFRTPLTLLLGPAEDALAEADRLAPGDRERWQIVRRNGVRLLRLVNTLLDFSRIEAGRMQASYAPTDLGALTRDLASVFRSTVERAGLRLEIDVEDLGEPVFVDHDMWEKVVLNLLSNAFKFTFEGEIRVGLRRRGPQAVLTVRDTGIGVAAEQLPRLFDRFHRVPGARGRTHEGTGIGLALVHELVKLHGGAIEVTSAPGRGTAFSVAIPFGDAHLPREHVVAAPRAASLADAAPFAEEATRWSAAPGTPDAAPQGAKGARVLLADDNADMRDYVMRVLGEHWNAEAVGDGASALARARAEPRPDLIISDIMMPGMDGRQLLAALRADPRTRGIPVIFLSARAGEDARVEGLAAGADDYLVKPFSARELAARVSTHLELSRLRVEAERARSRLFSHFMQAPVPVSVMIGPEHVYDLANPLYERLIGHTGVVGKPIREVFPEVPPDAPIFATLDRVYQTGEPFTADEYPVAFDRKGNGTVEAVFLQLSLQPIRDEGGIVIGLMTVAVDVTAQVHARRAVELANRSKDEFLAILGHELRNPLAPIVTAVQLMKLRGDGGTARERTVIERQVNHLSRLVDDLLDVSRITRGKVELKREQLELSDIVAKAIEMAGPLIEQREHDLIVDVPPRGLAVEVDAVRMAQVVSNLLNNAAKYTEPRGQITITARAEPGAVVLGVRDNGIGMNAEMLSRVFGLFVQESQAIDRAQGGLGLGLAIVRALVDLHGGIVEAHSDGQGQGSEFVVRLPAVVTVRPARPPAPPQRPPISLNVRRARVLVVDDNADAAGMLAESVRAMGHVTAIAYDGPSALRVAADFHPDVALLDIGLPVMDGYELAHQLRALPGLASLALIAVTGYGQPSDRARAREAGFVDHLVKPVRFENLAAVLARTETSVAVAAPAP